MSGGNKSEAARLLHMSRRRLYSRMQHHDIEY
ncbi:helix-turn-helix domain-containing protein [Gemmatimonadota bacterium]